MDSRSVFAEYLNNNSSLTAEEIELVCSYFQPETIKRDEPLLVAGTKYKKIIFVVEGILRVYVTDINGEEVVKNFIEPEGFFSDIESFDKNQASVINVSAVTDCKVLTLLKTDANALVGELQQWEYLMKVGALQAMNDMIRKQNFLRIGDSVDQYRYFVKHFPYLAKQVPLKYIASYLRITQSSLSRIRRQID
ncbi:MAG: Crp/Fnr family transcriptional regulator [Lentimicrobium sp.]